MLSLGLLAAGICGVIYLEQSFDPNSFIPADSYLKDYVDAYEKYFSDQGVDNGYIYMG